MSLFPSLRMRRLRQNEALRSMVRETEINAKDFIYPLFVIYGQGVKNDIKSLPGVCQYSVDQLLFQVDKVVQAGIPAVLLFGIPEHKDALGSSAWNQEGEVQRATRAIKARFPDLIVITDVCMCEYTDHGHCGWVDEHGCVDNDRSLELLGREALSHAQAGADIIAPSDMMDGRIGYLRNLLDKQGYSQLPILAYAAKYASGFYGPFREAAGSAPQFGDRQTYQMDPANADEALREVELDIKEGADMIMVKPALPYLDVIQRVKANFPVPLAAYQVSGEYAMLKAAAANGWLDERRVALESLTAIKRAGADMLITYYALQAAEWLRG